MSNRIRKILARICVLAVISSTVLPGTVPVMADMQPEDIPVMTDEQSGETELYEDMADNGNISGENGFSQEDIAEALLDEKAAGAEENGDILAQPENERGAEELTADPDISMVSDNMAENPDAARDVNILEDETPEQFLERVLGAEGELPDYAAPKSIDDSDFSAARYPNRIIVSNNSTVSGNENDLYAVIVSANEADQPDQLLWGGRIQPGKTLSIYHSHNKDGGEIPINESADYMLWLGRGYSYGSDEVEDFGFLGRYIEEGKTEYTQYNILYKIKLGSDKIDPEKDTSWADGYSGINLKAAVQKNMSVKFSWSPNGKDKVQKTFKKYALFELVEDSGYPSGYKEIQRWPLNKDNSAKEPSGSRSATLKPGWENDKDSHILNSSMIYLLKCYDKDGKTVIKEYVTTVAPYFLQMQSGNETGEFEYKFTQDKNNSARFYRLEVAEKNREADDRNPTGYHEEWSVDINGESLDIYSIGDYMIAKNNQPRAVSMIYSKKAPEAVLGRTYYGRIQTVAYIGGLKVISAPSNVLNVKAGPNRCYVIDIAGVYYDVNDARLKPEQGRNARNIERASAHINGFLDGVEMISHNGIYIHEDNKGTDLKSGMIFFIGEDDESNIQSYELLRSENENGPYKSIKNYALNNNMLLKLKITSEYLKDYNFYAMQYTSFPLEKDYYYTVRAKTKKGGYLGGYGNGEYNRADMDKVQGLATVDSNQTTIALVWEHDDCVKQYWLYRSEKPFPDMDYAPVDEKNRPCPIAKLSGGSFKKTEYDVDEDGKKEVIRYHIYYDKKVRTDVKYYYFVRPIYNTKIPSNLKDPTYRTYNMDKCSKEVEGKASAAYAQVKNFKASNYAAETIRLSFSQIKTNTSGSGGYTPTRYRIYRLKVDKDTRKLTEDMKPDLDKLYHKKYEEKMDYSEFEDMINGWKESEWDTKFFNLYGTPDNKYKWERAGLTENGITYDYINGDGKTTKTRTVDNAATVGEYYFYLIQFSTRNSEDPDKPGTAGQIFTYTSRIQNVPLPVENVRAEYAGSGSGIRIRWNFNGRDNKNKDYIRAQISLDGGYNWIDRGRATEFTDYGLTRGDERTYLIRTRYLNGSNEAVSGYTTITASLPSRIELSNDNITVRAGEYAEFSAKPVRNGGGIATLGDINMYCSSGIINFRREGNTGKITGISPGTTYIRVECAGISRDVKVTVLSAATK
ncbi:MAG: hypothetical protein IJT80_04730 [Lachnospiraceae bacterium]|nr:hypothetical protein [Lachnospiraceae bacterium]